MSQTQGSSFTDILPDLEAGTFSDKINRALSDVAFGVVNTGKKGKIVITLDMEQIATSNQVNLTHSLKYVKPTANGKVVEENATETPMHVGRGGKLTLFPDTQEKLFDAPKRVTE